jgi:hypothetical protein
MKNAMERAAIWANAQAEDLRDAEGLYEAAREMKTLVDAEGASIFISRAKTHISYVEENGRKLEELIQKLENAENAPSSLQAVQLKVLQKAQDERIALLKSFLNEI